MISLYFTGEDKMYSIFIKTLLVLCCLIVCSSCAPIILAPGEEYIDSLLTEKQAIDLLTQGEWLEYKNFDSYKGFYETRPERTIQYFSDGHFKLFDINFDTNIVNKNKTITGRWRFVGATTPKIVKFHPDVRTHRIIQGRYISLSDDTVRYPNNRFINIDTISYSRMFDEIIFVTNKEFYSQIATDHGVISSHYRLKSK